MTFFGPFVMSLLLRVLFLHRFGRSWVQNIGFADTYLLDTFIFLNFSLETGEFEEKVKKKFFGWAKTGN